MHIGKNFAFDSIPSLKTLHRLFPHGTPVARFTVYCSTLFIVLVGGFRPLQGNEYIAIAISHLIYNLAWCQKLDY